MNKYGCVIGIMALFAPILCIAGGENTMDYSRLPYNGQVTNVIKQNVPSGFDEFYKSWTSPENLSSRIFARYYQRNPQDNDSSLLLIFYGNVKKGVFKIISVKENAPYGRVISQTDSIHGEWDLNIVLYDIDCDSINEVLLYSASGTTATETLGIVKIANGAMRILHASPGIVTFSGRSVEIDTVGNLCPRTVKVYLDGPVRYRPDTVKTYGYDAAKQSYQLKSVGALPKKD